MIKDFLSLVFPECCISCNEVLFKSENYICTKCRLTLPKTNYHLERENPLHKRFWGKVPVNYAFSYLKLIKGGLAQNLIYNIKYNGMKNGARVLGTWYGTELDKAGLASKFDILVSVPMHKKKLKRRGYNQSELFAEGLSVSMNIGFDPGTMSRESEMESQTLKSRFERWVNVNEIYQVRDCRAIKDKHVLLVDDVVTTGATFEACARELLNNGAREISIVAIACAQ